MSLVHFLDILAFCALNLFNRDFVSIMIQDEIEDQCLIEEITNIIPKCITTRIYQNKRNPQEGVHWKVLDIDCGCCIISVISVL